MMFAFALWAQTQGPSPGLLVPWFTGQGLLPIRQGALVSPGRSAMAFSMVQSILGGRAAAPAAGEAGPGGPAPAAGPADSAGPGGSSPGGSGPAPAQPLAAATQPPPEATVVVGRVVTVLADSADAAPSPGSACHRRTDGPEGSGALSLVPAPENDLWLMDGASLSHVALPGPRPIPSAVMPSPAVAAAVLKLICNRLAAFVTTRADPRLTKIQVEAEAAVHPKGRPQDGHAVDHCWGRQGHWPVPRW